MKPLLAFSVFVSIYMNVFGATDTEILKEKEKTIRHLDKLDDKYAQETIMRLVTSKFNLHSYKENYFLPISYRYNGEYVPNDIHDGDELPVETEYQVSVRYDFASNALGLGEFYSFGYTQRSWWQVYASSAFFRESNYQPELFVTVPTYTFLKKSFFKGFKLALIHQSNGRGGLFERSWNRISWSGFFQFKHLITELELWYRTHDKRDYNPDLLDYLGYGQLRIYFPIYKHLFKLTLRSNFTHKKSAAELIYSYPLPAREENDLFIFIKTFNGYGESLIDYNHNVDKISIGLAISR